MSTLHYTSPDLLEPHHGQRAWLPVPVMHSLTGDKGEALHPAGSVSIIA